MEAQKEWPLVASLLGGPHKAPKSEKGRPTSLHAASRASSYTPDDPNRVAAFTAYEALVEQLAPALNEDEKPTSLSAFFGKTYYEVTAWTHVYHVYYRVFMWHFVTLHLMFVGQLVGTRWNCIYDFDAKRSGQFTALSTASRTTTR